MAEVFRISFYTEESSISFMKTVNFAGIIIAEITITLIITRKIIILDYLNEGKIS